MLEEIALKKEIFEFIKMEMRHIGLMFLIGLVIFKIVFFNDNLIVVSRTILSLFWLFILPGYFIMLYWREKLEFTERFIIGTALSAGIIGIFSYYFGLFGLNVKYHAALLPFIIILTGFIAAARKKDLH